MEISRRICLAAFNILYLFVRIPIITAKRTLKTQCGKNLEHTHRERLNELQKLV